MTPYRDRLEAGEYDANKQAKKAAAATSSKSSPKKASAKK
jgi:hypothetical protein